MSCVGNFLELATAKCGADVGFGKIILLYGEKTIVVKSALTATAINAAIEAGTIVGVIKNWHTVAGAPVGEMNVERPGSGEMKLIRQEILADTLTFESNIANRSVIADLVQAGTIQGLLIDDLGNAFGEQGANADSINTMALNFSGKTSSSAQRDNATDKTVAVTVRYLVKDLGMLDAGIEVEDVAGKVQVMGMLASVQTLLDTSVSITLKLVDKTTQKAFDGAITTADVTALVGSKVGTVSTATYAGGILTLSISGTGFSTVSELLTLTISGDDFYMKESKYTIVAP